MSIFQKSVKWAKSCNAHINNAVYCVDQGCHVTFSSVMNLLLAYSICYGAKQGRIFFQKSDLFSHPRNTHPYHDGTGVKLCSLIALEIFEFLNYSYSCQPFSSVFNFVMLTSALNKIKLVYISSYLIKSKHKFFNQYDKKQLNDPPPSDELVQ